MPKRRIMIGRMSFFTFPNPVNDKAARTVATGVVAISVLTLVTGWWWLLDSGSRC